MHPLWAYMRAREEIRLDKLIGLPWPWSDDPILSKYKFTNVKRLHDRTTQAFLATYAQHVGAVPEMALYNCAVRRFFGTAEFGETIGWLEEHNIETLRAAVARCPRPWTGAYIICAGAAGVPKVDVVSGNMDSLMEKAPQIVRAIGEKKSWEAGFNIMRECHGFGGSGFMSKEVLQDYILWLHLSAVYLDDEATWTPIGPGAHRGLNRLAGRDLGCIAKTALVEIRALLKEIQPLWEDSYRHGELLTAHDIQFCLCEFDKYERVRLGQGRPRSMYKPQ